MSVHGVHISYLFLFNNHRVVMIFICRFTVNIDTSQTLKHLSSHHKSELVKLDSQWSRTRGLWMATCPVKPGEVLGLKCFTRTELTCKGSSLFSIFSSVCSCFYCASFSEVNPKNFHDVLQ